MFNRSKSLCRVKIRISQRAPQRIVHQRRVALPAIAFITWPTKNPNSLSLPALVFGDLVGIGRQHLRDRRIDRAGVGDLRRPFASTIAAGILAGLDHRLEHLLGDAAVDRAVGDQVEQLRQRLADTGLVRDRAARRGSAREQIAQSPSWRRASHRPCATAS